MANLNSGEPWPEMDLADLREGLRLGTTIKLAVFFAAI